VINPRLALEADLDVAELRARLVRMSDRSLLEFGRAADYMCTPYANLGAATAKAVCAAARGGARRVAPAARVRIISRCVDCPHTVWGLFLDSFGLRHQLAWLFAHAATVLFSVSGPCGDDAKLTLFATGHFSTSNG
jgi:hypothetical protein